MTTIPMTTGIESARALVERINPSPEFAALLRDALAERAEEQWISTGEFARALGIHVNTATNWCKAGKVKHYTLPTGVSRIAASEVDRIRNLSRAPAPA